MKLGLLTGGGDCQGLNAAIRSIVRTAFLEYKFETAGFLQGWKGIIEDNCKPLSLEDVSGILPVGGTILGTSRVNPRKRVNGIQVIVDNLSKNGVGCLLVIGDNDCQSIALDITKAGFPVIGIPATMDNNIGCTNYCIGFSSAVDIVAEALDKLHTTASSHHRVMILEVMGRTTGWVALYGGLAGGADWIIIPEVQVYFRDIIQHIKNRRKNGKYFSIIVVAEGATLPEVPMPNVTEKDDFGHIRLDKRNIGMVIGENIEKATGFETRVTILGHLQRGGSPSAFDRILATRMGNYAVELAKKRKFGRMITFKCNKIDSVELDKAAKESPHGVSLELYNTAMLFY